MKNHLSSLIKLSEVSRKLYEPSDVFETSRLTRNEKIKTSIYQTAAEGSLRLAGEIASLISANNAASRPTTVAFATGQTTQELFAELVRLHRQQGLSFANVIFFPLFQYYPLSSPETGCLSQLPAHLSPR